MSYDAALGSRMQTALISVERADVLNAESFAPAEWTALTDPQKKGALVEATRHLETLEYWGERVWPELQALKWPRIREYSLEAAAYVTGGIPIDTDRRILDRTIRSSTQQGSSSTTVIVSTALAGIEQEPDDFWNEGSVRIFDGTSRDEVRRVSDFVSSTGTLTVEAFSTSIVPSVRFSVCEPLHQQVAMVVFELAKHIARQGAGHVDVKGDVDPTVLMTSLVDRFLRRIRRRSFSVV